MDELVANLRRAHERQALDNNDWMTPATIARSARQAGRVHADDRLSRRVRDL